MLDDGVLGPEHPQRGRQLGGQEGRTGEVIEQPGWRRGPLSHLNGAGPGPRGRRPRAAGFALNEQVYPPKQCAAGDETRHAQTANQCENFASQNPSFPLGERGLQPCSRNGGLQQLDPPLGLFQILALLELAHQPLVIRQGFSLLFGLFEGVR